MFKALDKLGISTYYTDNNSNDNIIDICVQFGLTLMALGGNAILRENRRRENIIRRVNLICVAIMTIGCIMAIVDSSTTMSDFIQMFKTIGGLIQVYARYSVILYYKTPLIQLIRNSLLFWRIEDLSDKEKVEYLNFYQLQNRVYQTFLISVTLTVLYVSIKPFTGSLPLFIWTPSDNTVIFCIASLIDVVFLYTIAVHIIGFDITFVSICNNVTIQLKLLQARIVEMDYVNLNSDQIHKKMTDLIQYHTFLMNYAEIIQRSFISFFLIQYVFTATVPCAVITIYLAEDLHLVDVLESTAILISTQMQFTFYCFTLTEITTQAYNVGDAVFHSEWYQSQGNGHKVKVLLMLMRCQKGCEFTAGGLAKMNREAIIKIMKLSLSVLTFMKTVSRK